MNKRVFGSFPLPLPSQCGSLALTSNPSRIPSPITSVKWISLLFD